MFLLRIFARNVTRNITATSVPAEILFEKKLFVDSINWISEPDLSEPMELTAKIRYRQDDQKCILTKKEGFFSVKFEKPQRAITPGQSIVFYQNDICLGGGEIYKS